VRKHASNHTYIMFGSVFPTAILCSYEAMLFPVISRSWQM